MGWDRRRISRGDAKTRRMSKKTPSAGESDPYWPGPVPCQAAASAVGQVRPVGPVGPRPCLESSSHALRVNQIGSCTTAASPPSSRCASASLRLCARTPLPNLHHLRHLRMDRAVRSLITASSLPSSRCVSASLRENAAPQSAPSASSANGPRRPVAHHCLLPPILSLRLCVSARERRSPICVICGQTPSPHARPARCDFTPSTSARSSAPPSSGSPARAIVSSPDRSGRRWPCPCRRARRRPRVPSSRRPGPHR